ncbi:ARM repeat-containing protein [Nadsonia fulvescens var. elongata DSM 6958]|uniref:ARM repeat-containing protein n=1 Tax=Nadsonia fulvescens var. elongata DSM 6958 TaxID=857566 RepID=A0A1E3PLW0_9ASCO|nr:ARM repeat-containing protein [Nadsonia fulvescens var. elongata DSM 6958]
MVHVPNTGNTPDSLEDDYKFSTRSSSEMIDSMCDLITRLVQHVQQEQKPSHDVHSGQIEKFTENDLSVLVSHLDSFQELPQLLDEYLPTLVSQLILCFSSSGDDVNISLRASKVFYTLCKVRGAKIVCRFFSSDITQLVNIITWLENQVPNKSTSTFQSTWEQRYVVLLWLSILILAPFELESFGQDTGERVYNLSLNFLLIPGKERDAASMVLSKLVTRTDVKRKLLNRLYLDISKILSDDVEPRNQIDSFSILGCLQVLAQTLQLVDIESIKPYLSVHKAFLMTSQECDNFSNSQITKLKVKNLSRLVSKYMSLIPVGNNEDQFLPEEVEEILGELFDILSHKDTIVRYAVAKSMARIAQLMQGRFEVQVLEIIEGIFQCFDYDVYKTPEDVWGGVGTCIDGVSANLWHGALLTLAELLRRQLIPISSLSRLVSILENSLKFEQRLLVHVVGANIRDASCYVCWSLFRSYKDLPSNNLLSILQNMIQLACFDREINIRRAASASIQECIGRQESTIIGDLAVLLDGGNFEESIMSNKLDLIQALDYNTIGQKAKSFTTVASKVYDLGYTKSLTEFLIQRNHGIGSWDPEIRRLSARCLGILSSKTSGNFQEYVRRLASVYANVKNSISEYELRHGILYALGEIIGAKLLTHNDYNNSNNSLDNNIGLVVQTTILPILDSVTLENLQDTNEFYFAESFLHLLKSVILFIETMIVGLRDELRQRCIDLFFRPLPTSPLFRLSKVNSCLKISHMSIRNEAVDLIEGCSPAYITRELIQIWFDGMKGELDTTVTSTFAAVLGGIGEGHPQETYHLVIEFLALFISTKKNDTLTRSEAVKSLARLLLLSSIENQDRLLIIEALISAMDDYTTDDRGDVGSWSRLQAISGFIALFKRFPSFKKDFFLLESESMHCILLKTKLFRLAGESHDKLRLLSYQCLVELNDATAHILRENSPNNLTWKISVYFQFMAKTILSKDKETVFLPYIKTFLLGLVSTAGAIHVSKDSSEVCGRELMLYMSSSVRIFNTVIEFLKPTAPAPTDFRVSGKFINKREGSTLSQFEQKVSLCALRIFEKFFDLGLTPPVEEETVCDIPDGAEYTINVVQYRTLYAKIFNMHINTKNIAGRVLPSIRCFEGISQLSCNQLERPNQNLANIVKIYSLQALRRLVVLTKHGAPMVRERALESLYIVLQGKYNDILEDDNHEEYGLRVEESDKIIALLEESEYTNPPEILAENAETYMAYIEKMFAK